jgi:hypothetical protein
MTQAAVEITSVSPSRLETVIIFGGTFKPQGRESPTIRSAIPALTEKTRADLEAAASIGVIDCAVLRAAPRRWSGPESYRLPRGVMAKLKALGPALP